MGRRTSFVMGLGVLATLGAGTVEAQRTPRTVISDFRNAFADMFYVWGAPFRADARDWATAGAVVGTAGLVAIYDDEIQAFMNNHPNAAVLRAFEPFTLESREQLVRLGGSKVIYPMTATLYGAGFLLDSRKLREAGMGCVTAYQAQSVVHELTYHVISRRRPYKSVGNPYDIELGLGEWDVHSFYGGHAANFLTCATFWSEYFDLGAAEPVLYAIGLGIGIGRAVDQRHWSSDTVIGMAMGYAVGRIVAGRYQRRADERRGARSATSPLLDGLTLTGGPGGVVVGWQRTF